MMMKMVLVGVEKLKWITDGVPLHRFPWQQVTVSVKSNIAEQ